MTQNISPSASSKVLVYAKDNGYESWVSADSMLSTFGLINDTSNPDASMGTAVLVAGTVVVPTTRVASTSIIQLTTQSLGTVVTPMPIAITARTPGVSFTITSSDGTDTSTIGWWITEPK